MSAYTIPVYPATITFLILFGFMLLRYFSMSGAFYLRYPYFSPQNRRDIKWSVLSSAVFALVGVFMIRLWQGGHTRIYTAFEDYPLWYLPLSLGIYVFVQDTYFYWTHRWQHRHYFRHIHFAHHEARRPTAWTSFAFHPLEALIQALILPVLIMLIPIHLSMLGMFFLIMSFFGVTNHLGHEIYPRWLEKRAGLITAAHHQLHHEQMGKNFGLFFTWWDRWMKTEHA